MAMNREQKRQMRRQGELAPDGTPAPRRAEPRPTGRPQSDRATPTQFLREVRGELRKVAWPSRSEVVNYSVIVLFTVVILTAYIALLDFGFGEAIFKLFER